MPPSPLTPHAFVEIRLKICFSNTSTCFLFQLKTIPAGLYLLCMDASDRINEVSSMYYDSVCCDVIYTPCHASVCSPVIAADFCSWSDTLRDYGIKCGDVPSLYNLEVPPCWTKFGGDYSKYPGIPRPSPSVVLKRDVQICHWTESDLNMKTNFLIRWIKMIIDSVVAKYHD